jgi:iron(III) transport system ATP-binding protein
MGIPAVNNVDLSVEQSDILALLGPSGCGKTTVLRLIAGLDIPETGTVEIGGNMVTDIKTQAGPEKRQVGMVFQEYALFPHMNVSKNIAYGLPRSGKQQSIVNEMLSLVNLEGMGERMPHQLSGGEQQRVALARALAPSPQVLLLDEPFSNLDATLRTQMQQETLEILKVSGTSTIFVTHSQEEAMIMGDSIAIMNQGKIEQVDTPANIFHSPNTRFVAGFMGVSTFLPAYISEDSLLSELGSHPVPSGLTDGNNIEIMLRPTDITITPSDFGQGVIIKKIFQGSFYLYEVALSSGDTIKCSEIYSCDYELGTRVNIEPTQSQPNIIFVDGHTLDPKN